MRGFIKIFVCLLLGEGLTQSADLPVPGAVVGLVLLVATFCMAGQIDRDVERIFDGVASHLAILFVPAGVGIIAYASLLQAGLGAIAIAVTAGTVATIVVTGICMRLCLAGEAEAESGEIEPTEEKVRA